MAGQASRRRRTCRRRRLAAAAILFAPKKDGGLRMCLDFRELNAITIPDTTPLPQFDDVIDRLSQSRWFTALDLRMYHMIRIHQDHIQKTALNTAFGKFEFLVLPFGLMNAPAGIQVGWS